MTHAPQVYVCASIQSLEYGEMKRMLIGRLRVLFEEGGGTEIYVGVGETSTGLLTANVQMAANKFPILRNRRADLLER